MRRLSDAFVKSGAFSLAAGVAATGIVASARTAGAQEAHGPGPTAPSRTLEVQLNSGYTQGFGRLFPGVVIDDVAGAGVGVTADVGYRATPVLSIELEGQYQHFIEENGSSTNGVNANLGATLHASPESFGDPWLRVATGWRTIWQNVNTANLGSVTATTTSMFLGWEVVAIRLGYDLRTAENVAWAPIVGADLQTFSWGRGMATSLQWASFVFAGLQGRFDFMRSPAQNVSLYGK